MPTPVTISRSAVAQMLRAMADEVELDGNAQGLSFDIIETDWADENNQAIIQAFEFVDDAFHHTGLYVADGRNVELEMSMHAMPIRIQIPNGRLV